MNSLTSDVPKNIFKQEKATQDSVSAQNVTFCPMMAKVTPVGQSYQVLRYPLFWIFTMQLAPLKNTP